MSIEYPYLIMKPFKVPYSDSKKIKLGRFNSVNGNRETVLLAIFTYLIESGISIFILRLMHIGVN